MTWTTKELDWILSWTRGDQDLTAKDWSQLPCGRFRHRSLTVVAGRWLGEGRHTRKQAEHLARVLADFELTALVSVTKSKSVSAVLVLPEDVHPKLVFGDVIKRTKRMGVMDFDSGQENPESWDLLPEPIETLARRLLWTRIKELYYVAPQSSDPGFLEYPHNERGRTHADYIVTETMKGPIWSDHPSGIIHSGSSADPSKWTVTPVLREALEARMAERQRHHSSV